jgi:hypothetical protein
MLQNTAEDLMIEEVRKWDCELLTDREVEKSRRKFLKSRSTIAGAEGAFCTRSRFLHDDIGQATEPKVPQTLL